MLLLPMVMPSTYSAGAISAVQLYTPAPRLLCRRRVGQAQALPENPGRERSSPHLAEAQTHIIAEVLAMWCCDPGGLCDRCGEGKRGRLADLHHFDSRSGVWTQLPSSDSVVVRGCHASVRQGVSVQPVEIGFPSWAGPTLHECLLASKSPSVYCGRQAGVPAYQGRQQASKRPSRSLAVCAACPVFCDVKSFESVTCARLTAISEHVTGTRRSRAGGDGGCCVRHCRLQRPRASGQSANRPCLSRGIRSRVQITHSGYMYACRTSGGTT